MCSRATVVLLPALLAAAGPAAAAGHQWEFPLGAAALCGLRQDAGAVVLGQVFRLEAETALEAEDGSFHVPPVRPVTGREGAAGIALTSDGDAAASFALDVPTEGDYTVWVRVLAESAPASPPAVAVDGLAAAPLADDVSGAVGIWRWRRGPAYHLSAGLHALQVAWQGPQVLLDRLLISLDGQPPPDGLGAPAKSPEAASRGTLTTTDFAVPWVDHWEELSLRGSGLEAATAEASTDGGASWVAVPRDGRLAEAVPGGREARIRFRVTLVAARGGGPVPALRRLTVRYVGADFDIALENEKVRLAFSAGQGWITELRRGPGGRSCLAGAAPAPPFALRCWDPATGSLSDLPLEGCSLARHERIGEGDRSTLYLDYVVPAAGGEVRVTCSMALDKGSPAVLWRTSVTNATPGLHLVEVVAPIVHEAAIGGDPDDDQLLWPGGGGRRVARPVGQAPLRGMHCSATASMGWLDLYDLSQGGQGLAVANHDKTGLLAGLEARPAAERHGVDLRFSRFPHVLPGETWEGEPFALGIHEGDWHQAADWYRTWLYGYLPRPVAPAWLLKGDGWLMGGRPTGFAQDLPRRSRFAQGLGLDATLWWGQAMRGLGETAADLGCLGFPDPALGTEEELTKAIAAVREAGGHVGFCLEAAAWDPRYPRVRPEYLGRLPADLLIPSWEDGFASQALVGPDGQPVPATATPSGDASPYGAGLYWMCSAAPGWQQALSRWAVDQYVGRYGADLVALRGPATADVQPCYSPQHGHAEVGAWTRGFAGVLRSLYRGGQTANKESVVALEGFGDLLAADVGAFLLEPGSGTGAGESAVEVLPYTFPDCVLVEQLPPGAVVDSGLPSPDERLAMAFVRGSRFGAQVPRGEPADGLRAVLALRRETSQLLYGAHFLDDVGLSATGAGVRAKLFRARSRAGYGWLVNCFNPQGVPDGEVQLDLALLNQGRPDTAPAGKLTALVAELGGMLHPTEVQQSAEAARIAVPTAPLSTVVLLEQSVEALLWATMPMLAPGSAADVVIHYRPLVADVTGELVARLEVPEGWEAGGARWSGDKPQDVALKLRAPAGATPGGYPVRVVVQAVRFTWPSDEKAVVVEPFDAESWVAGGELRVLVTSYSDQPLEGEITLRLPDGVTAETTRHGFTLEPRAALPARIPVSATGASPRASIAVNVTVEDRTIQADAPLANGL